MNTLVHAHYFPGRGTVDEDVVALQVPMDDGIWTRVEVVQALAEAVGGSQETGAQQTAYVVNDVWYVIYGI